MSISLAASETNMFETESPLNLEYMQREMYPKTIATGREYISGQSLPPFGTPEQTRFMRTVYEVHRRHSATKRKFVDSLPASVLDTILEVKNGKLKQGITMRKDAALSCRSLLGKAQNDLIVQKQNNIGFSRKVKKFGIVSGYRSANQQFSNWRAFFGNKYYPNTRAVRSQKGGGEHGMSAANFLATYIGQRLASPGYSNHNDGLAVDFFTEENGKLGASTDSRNISGWRKSWFFSWLLKNANNFGFFQNTKINEPWHWEYRRGRSTNIKGSLPSLQSEVIPGQTEYINVDLKIDNTIPKTGIYIPPRFIRGSKANIILYLHGYKSGIPEASASIDKYWDASKFPFFAFREGLHRSGKNAILVAPTLGPKSQSGLLFSRGLDWFLGPILAFLQRRGFARVIGEVVLACHSGGGHPMLKLALGKNRNKVIEIWGFDCLYSGYMRDKLIRKKLFTQPNTWLQWAKKNPDKRLYIYYYRSTELESQQLMRGKINQKLNNVVVKKSDAPIFMKKSGVTKNIDPHYWVPITHLQERLSQLRWS